MKNSGGETLSPIASDLSAYSIKAAVVAVLLPKRCDNAQRTMPAQRVSSDKANPL